MQGGGDGSDGGSGGGCGAGLGGVGVGVGVGGGDGVGGDGDNGDVTVDSDAGQALSFDSPFVEEDARAAVETEGSTAAAGATRGVVAAKDCGGGPARTVAVSRAGSAEASRARRVRRRRVRRQLDALSVASSVRCSPPAVKSFLFCCQSTCRGMIRKSV
eukprot:4222851-Pleurochrysis_carterae.AAC.1